MRWLAIVFLVIASLSGNSQMIDKKYIDNYILNLNPRVLNLPKAGYIIDGVFFSPNDSLKLDRFLMDWTVSKICGLGGYRTEDIIDVSGNPGKAIVVMTSRGSQSNNQKCELFKTAIKMYDSKAFYFDHISLNSKDPVLLINDYEVPFDRCRIELKKIKKKNIFAIDIYKFEVSAVYYGEKAKNGLIKIWTYPNKKT